MPPPRATMADRTLAPGSPPDVVCVPEDDFLGRWVYRNPFLAGRAGLFARWFDDPTPREEVAARTGHTLGELLRTFNESAPLGEPIRFTYRGVPFAVVAMAGVCDDVHGERFAAFGAPVTLRCYLTDPAVLPQRMYEAADWNYMDAGRPGFVGYAYGVRHERTAYLAGIQSDLAVRYGYLFQRRDAVTEVRTGEEVALIAPDELATECGPYVPTLRHAFQRWWVPILVGAVYAWMCHDTRLDTLALLRFPLDPAEDQRGLVMRRVYRDLPARLGCWARSVRVGQEHHEYLATTLHAVRAYLGPRWQPHDEGGIPW